MFKLSQTCRPVQGLKKKLSCSTSMHCHFELWWVCACVCAVCKPGFLFTLCSNGFWLQCMFMYINILLLLLLLLYSRPIFGLLGLTVKQNWVEVMDSNINIWKTLRKWVKKIIIKKKRKEMSYSMTHYSTAIFGSQKPLGRTDGYQEWTAREKRVCSSSAHCRDYLHLCFKNTGCWVGLAWREKGSRVRRKGRSLRDSKVCWQSFIAPFL